MKKNGWGFGLRTIGVLLLAVLAVHLSACGGESGGPADSGTGLSGSAK
jgi:hypothetical protein